MSITFKAGEYYIGDPCYAFSRKNWSKLLNDTNYFYNKEYEFRDEKSYADGTAYGDGTYHDNRGHIYCVDAGLLGIIPTSIIAKSKISELEKLGLIITFETDFEVDSENGIFNFGHIIIDTTEDYIETDNDD